MSKPEKSKSSVFPVIWMIFIIIFVFHGLFLRGSNTQKSSSSVNYTQMCHDVIRMSVNNPSTLKIYTFSGFAKKVIENATLISQDFAAKNAYELEKIMVARCKDENGELTHFNIRERDY